MSYDQPPYYVEKPHRYIFVYKDGTEKVAPANFVNHYVTKTAPPRDTVIPNGIGKRRTTEKHIFEIDRPGITERIKDYELESVEKVNIGNVSMFEDDFGVRQSTHNHLFEVINEALDDE